jgi:hypothetical protein
MIILSNYLKYLDNIFADQEIWPMLWPILLTNCDGAYQGMGRGEPALPKLYFGRWQMTLATFVRLRRLNRRSTAVSAFPSSHRPSSAACRHRPA